MSGAGVCGLIVRRPGIWGCAFNQGAIWAGGGGEGMAIEDGDGLTVGARYQRTVGGLEVEGGSGGGLSDRTSGTGHATPPYGAVQSGSCSEVRIDLRSTRSTALS